MDNYLNSPRPLEARGRYCIPASKHDIHRSRTTARPKGHGVVVGSWAQRVVHILCRVVQVADFVADGEMGVMLTRE